MNNSTRISVITGDLTEGDDISDEVLTERLQEVKTSLQGLIGSDCIEEHEVEGSFDLYYNAPTEGLNALIDKLNNLDHVDLAYYRDEKGVMYPRI